MILNDSCLLSVVEISSEVMKLRRPVETVLFVSAAAWCEKVSSLLSRKPGASKFLSKRAKFDIVNVPADQQFRPTFFYCKTVQVIIVQALRMGFEAETIRCFHARVRSQRIKTQMA